MPKTHWKKLMNKEYLGSWDVPESGELIGTIRTVAQEDVMGADGKKEKCIVVRFSDLPKPMILNTTNCKAIQKALGSPYMEDWQGQPIQIGVERVSAFGDVVDALRVRPYKVKVEAVFCEECGAEIKAAIGMSPKQVADYTTKKYGRPLCSECAKKAKEAAASDTD